MRTNVGIDDELMEEALRIGGYKTKREAVEQALRLLIRLQRQGKIRNYRGKLKWEGNLEKMRADR